MQVTYQFNVHALPFLSTHETNLIGGHPRKLDDHLSLLVTNAFGLVSKLGEFQHTLMTHLPDIAVVTETKFTPEKCSAADSTFPGYSSPIRRDRTAHGGSVAVWLINGLAHQQLAQSSTASHEVIWLSLHLHCGRKVVVCAAYRPESSADDDISLLEHIDTMIPCLRRQGRQTIIAGDFNVHNRACICSNRTTTAGGFAEHVCLDHGLQQHVVVPTRGSNTLDLIMSDFAHTPVMHYFPPNENPITVLWWLSSEYPSGENPRQPGLSGGTKMQTAWHGLCHFFRTLDWSTL